MDGVDAAARTGPGQQARVMVVWVGVGEDLIYVIRLLLAC